VVGGGMVVGGVAVAVAVVSKGTKNNRLHWGWHGGSGGMVTMPPIPTVHIVLCRLQTAHHTINRYFVVRILDHRVLCCTE
jgi:hypothetical protein